MSQQSLFDPIPEDKFNLLSEEELIVLIRGEQKIRVQLQKENERLRTYNEELKQKHLLIEDQYITIKNRFFGKSSEREPSDKPEKTASTVKNKKQRIQLPSLRYPDAPLIERHVTLDASPNCSCCGTEMKDSGMTEDSEYLTVIPAQYIVIRQMHHKYRCTKCHGDMRTAPAPPRIKPGSSYSDEMMIDVAASKYCDLVPIERYATIAGREGLKDLPPQSLIEGTHNLADFVRPAYLRLKEEIKSAQVLHADETPHRMLEGSDIKSWYLWGVSTLETTYFRITEAGNKEAA